MPYEARAEDGSKAQLYPDSDNWQTLQDFCSAHTAVQLPDGVWNLSRTLNLPPGFRSLRGRGVDSVTLMRNGVWNGPVIGLGGSGRWGGGLAAAANVTIAGMTVWQTDTSNTNNKCIWTEGGDNLLVEQVRVRGSIYEGIVAGSSVDGVTVRNFEAWDCGVGDAILFPRSIAGINCTNRNLLCEDFVCLRCGQGIEGGNSPAGTFRRGLIVGPNPTGLGPSLGINIGSTGRGIYRLTVEDVVVRGYDTSVALGPNGIGRLCGCTLQRCDCDGGISFSGGIADNLVPGQPGEGPDTEGSFILDNILRINGLSDDAFLYNTGPNDHYAIFGREPVTFARNTVYYDGTPQTTPTFGFAGGIEAACVVKENFSYGLNAAPTRGDVASFTSGSNPAVPGMPNLTVKGNFVFNVAGAYRQQSIKIEGA